MSQFESLPNELLYDVCEFLNTAHLIHAFIGLNCRFNHLIYTYFQNHQFSFQSINKDDFDVICHEHLSIFIENIPSLHLSNDIETPNLCELLFSYNFTLDRFTHLKSLSIYNIKSFDIINQITFQCRSLVYLTHLNLIDCYSDRLTRTTSNIFTNIWNLSKLTHLFINDITTDALWLYKLRTISTSIEYLSMKKFDSSIDILDCLFAFTPYLKQLYLNITHWSIGSLPKLNFSSLISLTTSFHGHIHSLKHLLIRLPNLTCLTLETRDIRINGSQWQELLVDYVPKIKNFHLKMNFDFSLNANICNEIHQLIESFQTKFWLDEHQWYVRCDAYILNKYPIGVLYTLPYVFDQCSYVNMCYSKSTKLDDEEISPCNYVQFVETKTFKIDKWDTLYRIDRRFPNIHHLELTFPLIGKSDSLKLTFKQLTTLHVRLSDAFSYNHLQILLNQTHHLYSLKFLSFGSSKMRLSQLKSLSIRRLDLIVNYDSYGNFFTHEECIHLINSPLGQQCEVLMIELENRINILDLIDKMSHLRVLVFRCKDIPMNYSEPTLIYQAFVQWLPKYLSSKSLIIADQDKGWKISMWISRKSTETLVINDCIVTSNNTLTLFSRFIKTMQRIFSEVFLSRFFSRPNTLDYS